MKHIVKKLAPILMTLAMIGLGGQTAQAVVTLNGITWGDPFAGLTNLTKAQQLVVVGGLGGHVATWAELLTSADTSLNGSVSVTELETFLIAIGFPTASSNGLCPTTGCYARLSGVGQEVFLASSGASGTFGAPANIQGDLNLGPGALDGTAIPNEGMLWIVNTAPEPGIIGLLGFSLFGLAMLRKRQ